MPAGCLAQQKLQFLIMLVKGQYPAGFLMLVYLLEIDSPLVALMPFWHPLPNGNFKSPTTPHLYQVSRPRQPSGDVHRAHELNVSKRDTRLVEVEYCEDTRPGHQLEASRKQHEILCKRLKAKKVNLHTILLGVKAIYTSHTSILTTSHTIILKSSASIHKKPIRLLLNNKLTLCFMHTN